MRKKILIGAIIISGSGIGAYFLLSGSGKDVQYRTEKVATGNMDRYRALLAQNLIARSDPDTSKTKMPYCSVH